MKVIKSDGRYNFYNQGFTVIMEFRIKIREDRDLWSKVATTVRTLYGEPKELELANNRWRMNEHYRTQIMSDRKRRRIYLKDEGSVSMLLLMVQQ